MFYQLINFPNACDRQGLQSPPGCITHAVASQVPGPLSTASQVCQLEAGMKAEAELDPMHFNLPHHNTHAI